MVTHVGQISHSCSVFLPVYFSGGILSLCVSGSCSTSTPSPSCLGPRQMFYVSSSWTFLTRFSHENNM